MYKDKVVSYVKDALIVWSVCMRPFNYIEWVLHKKKFNPFIEHEMFKENAIAGLNKLFKNNVITEMYVCSYVDTFVKLDYNLFNGYIMNNFTINEAQWEDTLIEYTEGICKLYLSESLIKDKYRCCDFDGYCRYSLKVDLLSKPNKLDYISSLTRLIELNQEYTLNLPDFLSRNN